MAIGITRHCIPFGGAGGIMLPDTPVNLRITTQDATSADLQWDAHSERTRVYISSDGTSWTLLATVAAGTSTYQATLTDDLNFFQVRAYDGTHQSAASNTVETYLKWILKTTGDGSGVSTLRLNVSETQTLIAEGGVKFYTDAAGTLNESDTWEVTSGGVMTIYLRCPTDGVIVIPKRDKVIELSRWASGSNAADLVMDIGRLININLIDIRGMSTITGSPNPNANNAILINSNDVKWTGVINTPNITGNYWFQGNELDLEIVGIPQDAIGSIVFIGNKLKGTVTGYFPSGMTGQISIQSCPNLKVVILGDWPPLLDNNLIIKADVTMITSSDLSAKTRNWVEIDSPNMDWTGKVGDLGNMTALSLTKFRQNKFTKNELIDFLYALETRTGTLPSSIKIGETQGLNPDSDPDIIAAVDALKQAKNITTVTFVN